MSTFVFCIGIYSLKIPFSDFEPVAWLTLIIGGSFGLGITIIVNARSNVVLLYLSNAEDEKRNLAFRTIKKNLEEIRELSKLYLDTIDNYTVTSKQKRDALRTFLPRFNTFLSICQGTTPMLGDIISKENITKLEKNFSLLNDLFTILEFGTNQQFETNVQNLKIYSNNAVEFLNKISNK